MTPTREQLQQLIDQWRERSRKASAEDVGSAWHHAAVELRGICMAAALAPPSMPEPSPARAGYPYTVAGDEVMAQRFPQEAAPMPPIEVGDWVWCGFSGARRAVRLVDGDQVYLSGRTKPLSVSAEYRRGNEGKCILEIRKANGDVWRREPRP